MNRKFRPLLPAFPLAALVGFLFSPALPARGEERPPNVIFILLDNIGQEWFGCYGGEAGVTPTIDRLAAEGVRVEHCYTPPVCGPSRIVALTGRYPHSTGFLLHHDAALYSGGGLDPEREILFPRLFQNAGFVTGITGKWQVNNLYDEPGVLDLHGFDEHLVWPGSLDADRMDDADWAVFLEGIANDSVETTRPFIERIESRYWDPVFLRQGERERVVGGYGPDVSLDFTFDFLRRHRERPFMLYLPMVLTHGDYYPHPVATTPLNKDDDRPYDEMLADMLRYADGQIAQIVGALEGLGLRDDTLLLIASDNGTEQRIAARRDGRLVQGGLYLMNEPGASVAMVANCPARVPGGRVLPLADFSDIYPTLCDFVGVPLDPNHRPDGSSFADFLVDAEAPPHRDWILNAYHDVRIVRDERYKLYNDGRLYDLDADPDEQQDLSGSEDADAAVARVRLQAALDSLPPDVDPPFLLRSQSGFRMRTEARERGEGVD